MITTLSSRFASRPWFWFSFNLLLFGIHILTSGIKEQVYDAQGYWSLTQVLYDGGNFSLLNFDSALRGYLLPLAYVPAYWLVETSSFFSAPVLIKVMGALLAGLLFGFLFPRLWQAITRVAPSAGGQLLFSLAAFMLWRNYFNYSLSDFPALAALLSALLLLLPRPTLRKVLLAGALVAAATNIRPIYLAAVPLVALLVGWLAARPAAGRWPNVGKALLLYLTGFALLTAPQWLINRENFGSNWPLVIGIDMQDAAMLESGDLYLQQINMGLSTQKYETGIARDFPIPQISYHDPIGALILRENYNQKIDSYREYIELVLSRPFDLVALNARHLFNGLDVLYPTPYITRVYTNTARLALLNYTLLFAASVVLLRNISRVTPSQWLCVLPVIAPAILMIPLPVECRYLMPVHLLLLAIACFGWPAEWSWRSLAGRRLPALLAYLIFVSGCFVLSANTQAQLNISPKLLTHRNINE